MPCGLRFAPQILPATSFISPSAVTTNNRRRRPIKLVAVLIAGVHRLNTNSAPALAVIPIGARHDQGRSKASIRKGKQGQGSREGRQDCHKTEPQGYGALRCGVLAGYGQQEQGKSTYPGGDPALNVTTGTDQATRLYGTARRPAFRRTSSSGPSKNVVQASAATDG